MRHVLLGLALLATAAAQSLPERPAAPDLPIGPGYVLEFTLPIQVNVTRGLHDGAGAPRHVAENGSQAANGVGEQVGDPAQSILQTAGQDAVAATLVVRDLADQLPACLPPDCVSVTLPAPAACGVRDVNGTLPQIQTCGLIVQCRNDTCEAGYTPQTGAQGGNGQDGELAHDLLAILPHNTILPVPAENQSASPARAAAQPNNTPLLVGAGVGAGILALVVLSETRPKAVRRRRW